MGGRDQAIKITFLTLYHSYYPIPRHCVGCYNVRILFFFIPETAVNLFRNVYVFGWATQDTEHLFFFGGREGAERVRLNLLSAMVLEISLA